MRERSQGRRKPRGGDFRSVAEKILPRTLDVVTRITLYGKAAALWVVASACFLAKERFRDKPSGKPLFLKGLLRTGGSCTQRGGQSPLFFFFFFYFFQVFFTSFYLYIFFIIYLFKILREGQKSPIFKALIVFYWDFYIVLLGLLYRFIGTFISFYWDFYIVLLGLLYRFIGTFISFYWDFYVDLS